MIANRRALVRNLQHCDTDILMIGNSQITFSLGEERKYLIGTFLQALNFAPCVGGNTLCRSQMLNFRLNFGFDLQRKGQHRMILKY